MLKYMLIITFILGLNTSHAYSRHLNFKRPVHLQLEKLKLENFFKRFRCKHTSTKFKCVEPVRNYDGDTITVNIPNIHELFGKEIPVRLLGVDTAEIRTSDDCEKEMAERAKVFVENELSNATTIHLYNVERDKYFRIAANVIIDGQNLSQKLINENLAYPYEGDTKPDVNWCQPLDEQFDMTLN